ncbi:MAG TPA: hypothetical protein PLE67_10735 [Tenuifilaceae bacterium]|nr:hypothetical protein [Tenuifilaceae bacterium]HPQ34953.1 hypothetical protein [Tenuifilaceae bacterium]
MKTRLIITSLVLLSVGKTIFGQVVDKEILNQLPRNIEIDKSKPKSYTMTTDYYDYDLQANFIRKSRVIGNLTCYLKGDTVKWNNVFISQTSDFDAPFPKGQNQSCFENFKYVQSEKILGEETFSKIPQIDFRLKNLVWDMFGFEIFAYAYWDSLELNKEFCNHELNSEVEMAKDGTFENKEVKLTWIGITKVNNELCAIIKYSQMNGKLSLNLENIRMKGRSHYWGEVYVSLSDKQIEYATLSEDVISDVTIKGGPENILGYTVRKIELEKTK